MTLWDDLDKAYAEVESLLVELPPGNAREVVRMLVGQLRGCAKRLRLLSQASREHIASRIADLNEARAEATAGERVRAAGIAIAHCRCAPHWAQYGRLDPSCPVHDIADEIREMKP